MATQAERTGATVGALVAAATTLFGTRGYEATSIDDIATAAGVTRGALYHHFDGKGALFARVFEDVQARLAERSAEAAARGRDPLAQLRAGARAFLDGCRDPAIRRIALVDAPAVLGWATWREIDERHFLAGVRFALQAAMDTGQLRRRPVEPLAAVLMGALTEAAMAGARAEDPDAASKAVTAEVDRLLRNLA